MLLHLALLLGVWLSSNVVKSDTCPVHGKTPPQHSESHNFVIDTFAGGKFPFAIGRCTATNVVSNKKWHKYVCTKQENSTDNDWSVVKTEFTDAACSGAGTVISTIGRNTTGGSVPNFECEGVNSFAKLKVGSDSSCTTGVTVYAGLNGCTPASSRLHFEFYCNESVAFMEFFDRDAHQSTTNEPIMTTNLNMSINLSDITTTELYTTSELDSSTSDLCGSNKYCEVWILASGKCTVANTSVFRNLGVSLYGQLESCHTNLTRGTEPPRKSGSRFQLAITAIFTLFLAVAWL